MVNKEELFKKAELYRSKIMKARPLNEKELKELNDYFRVGLTYSSNALEGNTLSITETKILLEEGLTVGGKPIKDYYEATGHAKAYDYMLELSTNENFILNEEIIKKLHFLFYQGIDLETAGQYRTRSVIITGTEYLPPKAENLSKLMKQYVLRMNDFKNKVHPIEYAALLHKGLVDIHPFEDGNGRTARLLMNIYLIHEGYGVVSIPPVLRGEYINSLVISQRAKNQSNDPFICLLAECVIETQRDYIRLLRLEQNNRLER